MFPTCVMTAADYWRGSAAVMRREDVKNGASLGGPPDLQDHERLTEAQFTSIAHRSFQAALKLSCLCSGRTTHDLEASFAATKSAASCEDELQEDESDAEDHEGAGSFLIVFWLEGI